MVKTVKTHKTGIEGPVGQTILKIMLLILLFLTLLPVFVTVLLSLKTQEELISSNVWAFPKVFCFENYVTGFSTVISNMLNTIIIDIISVVIIMLLSCFVAYIFVQKQFPGKAVLFSIIILPMLVPSVVSLTPSYLNIVRLGLYGNWFGLILPYIAGNQIASIFLFKVFIGQQPKEFYEAATLDGAGEFKIFLEICLPMSFPIMMVQGVSIFAAIYNDYLWPLLIFSDAPQKSTLMPRLKSISEGLRGGAKYAIYLISGIPLIFTTVFSLKFFIDGEFASGLKL